VALWDPALLELADEGSEKEEKSLAKIDVGQRLRSFDGGLRTKRTRKMKVLA
jgi:hypothetical protein